MIERNKECKIITAFGRVVPVLIIGLASGHAGADTFILEKRDTGASIDGNQGTSQEFQQVYLWATSSTNEGQQWDEISYGNNFFAYQKKNTSLCLDGGDGGARKQPVLLLECSSSNQNQQWLKVPTGGNSYRLAKRNAQDYSIDGSSTSQDGQEVFLWSSNSNNSNQQWEFLAASSNNEESGEVPIRSAWALNASSNQGDLSNAIDSSTATRWTTGEEQNNGQWLTIDLSAESTFNSITLDSDGSSNDYPRGYAVFVSDDGSNWGAAVATGRDSNSTTEITFDDVTARYIRIEQTGSVDRFWWSIHDLSVSLGDDVFTPEPPTPTNDWTVDNLQDLRSAVQRNNQDIVMRAGDYNIADLDDDDRWLHVSGNNNTIDLTGVTIEYPVELNYDEAHVYFSGSGNTLVGGTIENTYNNGMTEVTDFVSYNEDRSIAKGGKPHMVVAGDDTTILNTTMIVRGSFPYGYGSYLGINGNNVFGLQKKGGIQVNSSNTVIDGIELYMNAFGHAIYIGPGEGAVSDNTIIRNSLVQSEGYRATNDMLAERGGLLERNNYRDADGNAIPANDAETLGEDGIRTYPNAGSVFVDNTRVIGMRSGFRLYNATVALVTNSIALDNRIGNFQMRRDSEVNTSSANWSIGPAIWVSGFQGGQDLDVTLIPTPEAIGPHDIVDVQWGSNNIILRRTPGPIDSDEERVIRVRSTNNTITNYTEYTILLDSDDGDNNTIISAGEVIDNGSGNDVTRIDLDL